MILSYTYAIKRAGPCDRFLFSWEIDMGRNKIVYRNDAGEILGWDYECDAHELAEWDRLDQMDSIFDYDDEDYPEDDE